MARLITTYDNLPREMILRGRMFEIRKELLIRVSRSKLYRRRLLRDYLLYGAQLFNLKNIREYSMRLSNDGGVASLFADNDREKAVLEIIKNEPELVKTSVSEFGGNIEVKLRIPVSTIDILDLPPGFGQHCKSDNCD